MADPAVVDRLALPDKIKDLLRPPQLPPPVAEPIVEPSREPDEAGRIFSYHPQLEESKIRAHPDISQHIVEMAGAIHAGRIDPTLPSATPEEFANILLQAHLRPENPAVLPSKVLVDGAALDWNDSRALARVQEMYISARRVEQMIDDYRWPNGKDHQLGTTFATGTALNDYLKAHVGEAIPVLLHTHDEAMCRR